MQVCFFRVFVRVLLLVSLQHLGALEYRNSPYGYFLDLPEGWKLLSDDGSGGSAFSDPDSRALLQVFSLPGGSSAGAVELYEQMKGRLAASGEAEAFDFSGRDAVIAVVSFSPGKMPASGYLLCVRGDPDYVVLAFAPREAFAIKGDALLSALNSFSPDTAGELLPGPMSQYLAPLVSPEAGVQPVAILGRTVSLPVGKAAIEVSQALIEREARLLVSTTGGRNPAWQRYYRMVYRDCFYRLSDFGSAAADVIEQLGLRDEDVPQEVLSWIQGFTYERTGTLSDLLSPVQAAFGQTGDCDSRALLYIIVLRYLSFDTTLFVSEKYSHSVAGVAVPGKGARMEAGGRSYLVAELTAKVQLGLIDRTMADPSAWLAVPLPEPSGM